MGGGGLGVKGSFRRLEGLSSEVPPSFHPNFPHTIFGVPPHRVPNVAVSWAGIRTCDLRISGAARGFGRSRSALGRFRRSRPFPSTFGARRSTHKGRGLRIAQYDWFSAVSRRCLAVKPLYHWLAAPSRPAPPFSEWRRGKAGQTALSRVLIGPDAKGASL